MLFALGTPRSTPIGTRHLRELASMNYAHLVGQEKACASAILQRCYDHFLHGTTLSTLKEIKRLGLVPGKEDKRSSYLHQREEPDALRYALPSPAGLEVARSAARTRSHTWNENEGFWSLTDTPVMLRIPASVFLERSIGLDHSHVPTQADFDTVRKRGEVPMSARSFVKLVRRHGIISCYEQIPAADIGVTFDLEHLTQFQQLTQLKL